LTIPVDLLNRLIDMQAIDGITDLSERRGVCFLSKNARRFSHSAMTPAFIDTAAAFWLSERKVGANNAADVENFMAEQRRRTLLAELTRFCFYSVPKPSS